MKLHLPKRLFTALVSSLVMAAPMAITLASGALVFAAGCAMGVDQQLTENVTWDATNTTTASKDGTIQVGGTTANRDITLTIIEGANIEANWMLLRRGGNVNMTGGQVTLNKLHIHNHNEGGATEVFTLSGGVLEVNAANNFTATGTGDKTPVTIGHWGNGGGKLVVSGGTLQVHNGSIYMGYDSHATLQITAGEANVAGLYYRTDKDTGSRLELSGGRLNIGSEGIRNTRTEATSSRVVSLTGGTLGALDNWTLSGVTTTIGTIKIDTDKWDAATGATTVGENIGMNISLLGNITAAEGGMAITLAGSGSLTINRTLEGTITTSGSAKVILDSNSDWRDYDATYVNANGESSVSGFVNTLQVAQAGSTFANDQIYIDGKAYTITDGIADVRGMSVFGVNDTQTYDSTTMSGVEVFHVYEAGTLTFTDGQTPTATVTNQGKVVLQQGENDVNVNTLLGILNNTATSTTTITTTGAVSTRAALNMPGTLEIENASSFENKGYTLTLDKLILNNVAQSTINGTGGGSGKVSGIIEVLGKSTLILTGSHDLLGWGATGGAGDYTDKILLRGTDAENKAILQLNTRQTCSTAIVLEGYSSITNGGAALTSFSAENNVGMLHIHDYGSVTATGTNNTISAVINANKATTINVTNQGDTLDITGTVFGSGAITKSGAGTLTFAGNMSMLTGAVNVSAGKVIIASSAVLSDNPSFNVTNNATLSLEDSKKIGKLNAASGVVEIAKGKVLTLAGGSVQSPITHNIKTLSGMGLGSTLNLDANSILGKVTAINGSVTLTGSGTYNYGSYTYDGKFNPGFVLAADDWIGTIALSVGGSGMELTHLAGASNQNSKLQLTGFKGYLDKANNQMSNNLILVNGTVTNGVAYALMLDNGSSSESPLITFSGSIEGSGNLVYAWKNGAGATATHIISGNTSSWEGKFVRDLTNGGGSGNGKDVIVEFTAGGDVFSESGTGGLYDAQDSDKLHVVIDAQSDTNFRGTIENVGNLTVSSNTTFQQKVDAESLNLRGSATFNAQDNTITALNALGGELNLGNNAQMSIATVNTSDTLTFNISDTAELSIESVSLSSKGHSFTATGTYVTKYYLNASGTEVNKNGAYGFRSLQGEYILFKGYAWDAGTLNGVDGATVYNDGVNTYLSFAETSAISSIFYVDSGEATIASTTSEKYHVAEGAKLVFNGVQSESTSRPFSKEISGAGDVVVTFDTSNHNEHVQLGEDFTGILEVQGNMNLANFRLGKLATLKLASGQAWASTATTFANDVLLEGTTETAFSFIGNAMTFTGKVTGTYLTTSASVTLHHSLNNIGQVKVTDGTVNLNGGSYGSVIQTGGTVNLNGGSYGSIAQTDGTINIYNKIYDITGTVTQTSGTLHVQSGGLNIEKQWNGTGGLVKLQAGEISLADTLDAHKIHELDMAGETGWSGKLSLAAGADLTISTNLWLGGTAFISLLEGATLSNGVMTFTGKGTDSIIHKFTDDLTDNALVTGSTKHEIINTDLSVNSGSATTIALKLTNSGLTNAGSGTLEVTNAENTITSLYAQHGDITLSTGMSVSSAQLEAGRTLKLGAGTETEQKKHTVGTITTAAGAGISLGDYATLKITEVPAALKSSYSGGNDDASSSVSLSITGGIGSVLDLAMDSSDGWQKNNTVTLTQGENSDLAVRISSGYLANSVFGPSDAAAYGGYATTNLGGSALSMANDTMLVLRKGNSAENFGAGDITLEGTTNLRVYGSVSKDNTKLTNNISGDTLNITNGPVEKGNTSDGGITLTGNLNLTKLSNQARKEVVLSGESMQFGTLEVKSSNGSTTTINGNATADSVSVQQGTLKLGDTATITKAEGKDTASMQNVKLSEEGIASADETGDTKGTVSDAKVTLAALAAGTSFSIEDVTLSNVNIEAANAEDRVNLSGVSATDVQLTKGEFHMLDKPQVGTGGTAINLVEGGHTGLDFSTSLLNGMTLGADASMVVDLGDLSGFTGMDSGKPTFSITLEGFRISDYLAENPGIYFAADSWLGQLLVAQGASQYVKGDTLEAGAQATAGTGSGVSVSYKSTAVGTGTVIIISGLQVPEPTTTSLSLLALSALAMRRRRK